jgi:acetyltransferase-like isoleucine patch superfamily enzyme
MGRAYVQNHGRLRFGDRLRLDGRAVRLEFGVGPDGLLDIGDGTYINYGSSISALLSVRIGQDCAIGQYAIIMDSNYHQAANHRLADIPKAIVIEDEVWIGARVTILPGSRIGRGAVIGAHSVVRGEIPPRSLAGGVPARVIRSLDP